MDRITTITGTLYLLEKFRCYEELHTLYSLSHIIRIIKSRRIKRVGYVARMGGKMNEYRLLVGKHKGKSH
jgi:hypothetical protein